MYLAKEPVYTIMLVGRWSSDAFLAYIEKQIKEFTKGVSSRMPTPQSLLLGIRPLPPRPDRAQHITQIVNLCLMPLPSSSPSMSPHLAANASTVA